MSVSAALAAPSFTLVGSVPSSTGQVSSRIHGLSSDGRSAAGYSATGHSPGFLWTADGGRNDFGVSSSFTGSSEGYGISGDGRVVVGTHTTFDAGTITRPYRWSESNGLQDLELLPGFNWGMANDASHDGSVVVGYFDNGAGGTAGFRWTEAGGMQAIGGGTRVHTISSNGNVIVGELGSTPQGFTWTQASGIQFLPSLGGSGGSYAYGINFTGDIIVGLSSSAFRPTIWVGGIPTELLSADVNTRLTLYGVSDDGTVVGGQLRDTQGRQFAGVWTASTGAIRLTDYFTSNGVMLPDGIDLVTCTAMSADGLTFAGYTSNGPFGIQG